MNKKESSIKLDLYNQNPKALGIKFTQNDIKSNVVNIQLMDKNNVPFPLDTATNVYILFKKSDNTYVQNDCEIIDSQNGKIKYDVMTTEIQQVGKVYATIQVLGEDGSRLTFSEFYFDVGEDYSNNNAVQSTNEYTILLKLIDDINDIKADIENAEILRINNENGRVINETDRINAENIRVSEFENMQNSVNKIGNLSGLNTTNKTDLVGATNEIVSQLNDMTAQKINRTANKRKAFITIIDDDGRTEFISNGHSGKITAHPNSKISLAINPDKIGTAGYLTWNDIATFMATGQYEIINHGWGHQEPLNLTVDQLKANYVQEKSAFTAHGLNNYDYYVYAGYTPPPANPNQVSNADLKNRLRQVYKCCLANTDSQIPYIPFDSYEVRRISAYSVQAVKDYIDQCINTGAWCVLFGHAWMTNPNQADSSLLDQVLTYIDTKVNAGLIEYKTVKEVVDTYSNIIELGNGTAGADYFRLDKNGNVDFSINGRDINNIKTGLETLENAQKPIVFPSTMFTDKDITTYPADTVTIEQVDYNTAIGMGLPDVGMITTTRRVRSGWNEQWAYQLYERTGKPDQYMRYWIYTLNRWSLFYPVTNVSCATTARPRYVPRGFSVYDTTLLKPIWQKYSPAEFTASVALARNTAYKKWDVVNQTGADMFLCIVAGTSGASEPTWDKGATYNNTVDGTVTWQYLGNTKASWCDATGAIV